MRGRSLACAAGESDKAGVDITRERIRDGLTRARYLTTEAVETVLFLALSLEKPLLIEGPAGAGKTEIGKVLGTAGPSLLGDRIQNAIQTAARSARVRQSVTSIVKSALAKVATAGLGGPLSWTMAVGQGVYELFGPNYTIALGLIAQIGLLRQKYDQLQRDIAEQQEEAAY